MTRRVRFSPSLCAGVFAAAGALVAAKAASAELPFTTPPPISTGADGARAVLAADVDGDGDLDVLSASFLGNRIAWYRNEAIHRNACFGPPSTITSPPGTPLAALMADVDGDGAADVAWATATTVAWERDVARDGSTWSRNTVASGLVGQQNLGAGDLDRDGHLDLVGAGIALSLTAHVEWLRQPAAEAWPAQTIVTSFSFLNDLVVVGPGRRRRPGRGRQPPLRVERRLAGEGR